MKPRWAVLIARLAAPLRQRSHGLVFWISLVLSTGLTLYAYRGSTGPEHACPPRLFDVDAGHAVALPLRRTPEDEDIVLRLEHAFELDAVPADAWGVYLGEVTPFYALHVNGRDLTPGVDLGSRARRDFAPQLQVLPRDALRHGENRLRIEMPVAALTSETRIGDVCVGPLAELKPRFRAEWWRRVGLLGLCLALFVVLAMVCLAFRRLMRGGAIYTWYFACLALMGWRTGFLVIGDMPGGPVFWRALSDASIPLLVYAMYRTMGTFWDIRLPRWSLVLPFAALLRGIAGAFNLHLFHPVADSLFWIGMCAVALALMLHVRPCIRRAPPVERYVMQWAMLFAIACGSAEALTYRLDPPWRLVWTYPPGIAALALMFGFLIVRRAMRGTRWLHDARRMFGHDLDHALSGVAAQGSALWQNWSAHLAGRERQQVLHEIQDGFGLRMQEVLDSLRARHPQSQLALDIERALRDLRLMIDALEERSITVRHALDTLRQRMAPPLAALGLRSEWHVDTALARPVQHRGRLLELLRCIEELLSNVLQHAAAATVRVTVRDQGPTLQVSVEDDGRGMPLTAGDGRGMRTVRVRVQRLHGSMRIETGAEHRGTRVVLQLPHV